MQQPDDISEEDFLELFPDLPCLVVRHGCVWQDLFTEISDVDIFDPKNPDARSARLRQLDTIRGTVGAADLKDLTHPTADLASPVLEFRASRQAVMDFLEWAFTREELDDMAGEKPEIRELLGRRDPSDIRYTGRRLGWPDAQIALQIDKELTGPSRLTHEAMAIVFEIPGKHKQNKLARERRGKYIRKKAQEWGRINA